MAEIGCKFLYESSVQARDNNNSFSVLVFTSNKNLILSEQYIITPRRYIQDNIIENVFENNRFVLFCFQSINSL